MLSMTIGTRLQTMPGAINTHLTRRSSWCCRGLPASAGNPPGRGAGTTKSPLRSDRAERDAATAARFRARRGRGRSRTRCGKRRRLRARTRSYRGPRTAASRDDSQQSPCVKLRSSLLMVWPKVSWRKEGPTQMRIRYRPLAQAVMVWTEDNRISLAQTSPAESSSVADSIECDVSTEDAPTSPTSPRGTFSVFADCRSRTSRTDGEAFRYLVVHEDALWRLPRHLMFAITHGAPLTFSLQNPDIPYQSIS